MLNQRLNQGQRSSNEKRDVYEKDLEDNAAVVLYFLMYAIVGWAYEVFLEVVVYQWGYSDRGVLFGPYCPVYGVGSYRLFQI